MPPPGPTLDDLLQHAGWVRRLALSLCADPGRADDAVQDTWLSALHAPPTHAGNLRGWLGRVLRSALRQGSRAEHRRARRERAQVAGAGSFAEAAADAACRAELHRQLVQLVLALPEPQRAVVLLHYFDGLDAAAVAARAGLSPDAVRAHLRRARLSLRARLERQGGEAARGLALLAGLPARGLVIAMSIGSKLALGIAAAAAVAFSWWASVPVVPVTPGSVPHGTTLAADQPAADRFSGVEDPRRTALEPPRTATDGSLVIRLQGLRPQAPWTARLRIDLEGKVGDEWREHEERVPVEAGSATARAPAWVASAAHPKLRIDARDPFHLPVGMRLEGDEARAQEITVPVQPVGVLTGRVVDARGAGVEAVRVVTFAVEDGRARNVITGETTTRTDGTFTLQSRIEGQLLLLALPMQPASISGQRLVMEGGGVADTGVPRDDFLPASVLTEARHGEERDLATLVAGDPAWVTGSVHFADGKPVAGAVVQAFDAACAQAGLEEMERSRLLVGKAELWATADGVVLRLFAPVTAGDDGAFRAPATPGRSTSLEVVGARGIDFLQQRHAVTTQTGAVHLELPGRLVTISPMHRGTPIGKHTLITRTGRVNHARTTETPCTVLAAHDGPLTGTVHAEGFELVKLHIDVATAPAVVSVEMVPIEMVRLQLDLTGRTRVRQAELHFDPLDRATPGLQRGVFRNDGESFFTVDVPPGRYRLRIEAPAKAEHRDLFVLPSAHEIEVGRPTAPLLLPVGHGGSIRLTVVDARGLPLHGSVELTRDGTRVPVLWKAAEGQAQSGRGAYERLWHEGPQALQQPVPAGHYALSTTVAGRGTRRVDVEVKPFEVSEVRVQY